MGTIALFVVSIVLLLWPCIAIASLSEEKGLPWDQILGTVWNKPDIALPFLAGAILFLAAISIIYTREQRG